MATWVTHLMIADAVLKQFPGLDRRGFCVGNIAPDCNVENADWTAFTPSRAVTHWMQGERKNAADCDVFYKEYIAKRRGQIRFGVDPQLAEFISDPDKLICLHAEEGKPGAAELPLPGSVYPGDSLGAEGLSEKTNEAIENRTRLRLEMTAALFFSISASKSNLTQSQGTVPHNLYRWFS